MNPTPKEPLPTLHEGTLDAHTLDALFDDIARETTVLSVRLKGGEDTLAEDGDFPLAEAHKRLKQGSIRAVQVRYAHQGVVWTDTVLRSPMGYRVVRMAAPLLR